MVGLVVPPSSLLEFPSLPLTSVASTCPQFCTPAFTARAVLKARAHPDTKVLLKGGLTIFTRQGFSSTFPWVRSGASLSAVMLLPQRWYSRKKNYPCPCSLFICLKHWLASFWSWVGPCSGRQSGTAVLQCGEWHAAAGLSLINWSLTPGEECPVLVCWWGPQDWGSQHLFFLWKESELLICFWNKTISITVKDSLRWAAAYSGVTTWSTVDGCVRAWPMAIKTAFDYEHFPLWSACPLMRCSPGGFT